MLAAQPARLVLRGGDQIGNKGSVFALCTITSQPSRAMPLLTIIVDDARRIQWPHNSIVPAEHSGKRQRWSAGYWSVACYTDSGCSSTASH